MSRRLRLCLWSALLVLALGLRLPPLFATLPFIGYVDEGWLLHPVVHLVGTRTWDPGWYAYPSLPMYAIAGAIALYSPVYAAVHGRPLRGDLSTDESSLSGLVEPVEVIVAGRALTLLVSLGIVLLTGLLARRLAGEAAGLFAALLAALVPALVIRSAIASVDPWATFFVLAAIYFAEGAWRGGRARDALLAGAMLGCALTSKYPAILAALAVVPALLRVEGDWRRKVRTVALAAVAGLLAAMITMPALVLRSRAVVAEVSDVARLYGLSPIGEYWDQAVRRAEWDQPLDAPELGLPFLAAALLGWLAAARDRRSAGTAFAWALYAGVLGLVLNGYTSRPFRNLLPLVPLACALVALLFARVRERLRRPVWMDAAAAGCALALLLPSGITFARERAGQVDSRAEAIRWVASHAGPEEAVLVSAELAMPRSELARLPGEVAVLDRHRARARLKRVEDVRFVVTGMFGDSPHLPRLLGQGKTRVLYRLAARFGGEPGRGQWGGNRRVVLVYRRATDG